jgi:hypothetical protein
VLKADPRIMVTAIRTGLKLYASPTGMAIHSPKEPTQNKIIKCMISGIFAKLFLHTEDSKKAGFQCSVVRGKN